MTLFVGVDVGGTKVLAAEVAEDGTLLRRAHRLTPGRRVSAGLVEDAMSDAVDEVAAGRPVAGVGLALAGLVDAARERVAFAPHLPWHGEELRLKLATRWGTVVALDNDANCAALAEASYGAARGVAEALIVTLGTGIGGAVVIGGQVRRGRHGMAGEFGHMQVVPGGRGCECGGQGCWEQYSSGRALIRHIRGALVDEPGLLAVLGAASPDRLEGAMITAAAQAGEPAALAAYADVGDWLGVGVANLVAALDPEVVVVGGGVSAAGDLLLAPARTALRRSLVGSEHRQIPALVGARFGPEAGVVGAAALVRHESVRVGQGQ